jgi:hypothetical protein
MSYQLCFDNDNGYLVAYALDDRFQNTGNGKLDVVIESSLIDPKHVWLARGILEDLHKKYCKTEFSRYEDTIEEFKKTWPKFRENFMEKYRLDAAKIDTSVTLLPSVTENTSTESTTKSVVAPRAFRLG